MPHICCHCRKEPKSDLAKAKSRLPQGWTRIGSHEICKTCFGERYFTKSISIPVAAPVERTWEELRGELKKVWVMCSQAQTYMLRRLWLADSERVGEKLAPAPKLYQYPEVRAKWPELPPTTAAALEQRANSKYRSQRSGVIWRQDEQLATLRYPQPFIVPAQNWSIEITDTARRDLVLSLRLGGARWQLRLCGGADWRRQRREIEAMLANGDDLRGELAILRKRVGGSDRGGKRGQTTSRRGQDRGPGGQHFSYEVMAKMVAYFPVQQRVAEGTLSVRTASESLLVAVDDKDNRLWIYNADHLRRWVAEHASNLQRWSEDSKAEQRPIASFADRRAAAVVKFRHRIQSLESEAAAQLVNFAVRRKFATLQYDDSDKSFVDRFDWSGLKNAIRNKCHALGVNFQEAASSEVAAEAADPLADGE